MDFLGEVVYRTVRALWRFMLWSVVVTWRFITGNWMDGEPRTDAGWLRRGEEALTRSGYATRWSHLPRLHRAGWRLLSATVALVTLMGISAAPTITLIVWAVAVFTGSVYLGYRAHRALMLRQHHRAVVRPLYVALRQVIGSQDYPLDQMHKLLSVPVDYAENPDSRIVLQLPPTFGGDAKLQQAITRVVQHKLGVELDGHWSYVGSPYVEFALRPQPPQRVTLADIRERIAAAQDGEAVIGLGSRGETVSVYLDTETPHIGLSIGTGGGKSTILRGMVAQYRQQGAEIVIADVGVISLKEFEGVPGITIVTDVADIWQTLDRLQAEMERRYAEWQRNPAAEFDRLIFVLEEGNDFYLQSIAHWNEIREKKDPAVPPVFMKLAQLMVKARKVKIHVLAVYQNMDARTVGGGSAVAGPLIRAQFGMKILARFSPQTWQFLVGTNPRPKSSRHIGRAIVMVGDEMRITQMAYWEPDEARAVALSSQPPVTLTPVDVTPTQRQSPEDVTSASERPSLRVIKGGAADTTSEMPEKATQTSETTTENAPTIPAPPRRYTLAEAAREKVIPMSHGAIRQAKSTAKQKGWYFPPGRTINGVTRYTAAELQQWYENRRQPASGE